MHRSPLAVPAAFAAALLLAACGAGSPDDADTTSGPEPTAESQTIPMASDAGGEDGATQGDGTQDDGMQDDDTQSDAGADAETEDEASAAALDPYPVTAPPEGFGVENPCTGEGAYRAALTESAEPALPDRAGGSLDVQLLGIDEDGRAELTATVADEEPRPIEPAAVGDTVEVELWTLSVTSVCEDEVEFDLVN